MNYGYPCWCVQAIYMNSCNFKTFKRGNEKTLIILVLSPATTSDQIRFLFKSNNAGVQIISVSCPSSVQFGDAQAAVDLDGVDGRHRVDTVVEIEQRLTVHEHPEPLVLTVNLQLGTNTTKAL